MPFTKKELKAHATKGPFSKVRAAREILREKAVEILESYIALSVEARAAGEFEVAADILWKLIDHGPPDKDGNKTIDISVDKPKQIEASKGPTIQIGFQLGGIGNQKALPAAIDVTPVESIDE